MRSHWGPLVVTVPVRTRRGRLLGGLVAGTAAAVLVTARVLTPDPAGLGTHQQLGLGPCAFAVVTGYPCPTCGMTTAFAHAVRGHWLTAFHTQPMGFVLALVALALVAGGLAALALGRTLSVNWLRVSPVLLVVFVVALLLAAWAYKIVIVHAQRG